MSCSPTHRVRRSSWAGSLIVVLTLAACTTAVTDPSGDTRTAGGSPSAPPTTSPPAQASPATTSAPGSPSAPTQPKKLAATDIATGLRSPWGLVPLKDGSLLVSERDTGKILRIRGAQSTEVAELTEVRPAGEGGLLGLAITPDQQSVLAYFTAADDNRIVSMTWDGTNLGAPKTILKGIPKGSRHNGGRLVIGPDGLLYVGTGETGDEKMAQDKEALGGKILRVTPDGKPAPGNPFNSEVYSYGHRNVQGLAFDDEGRLWASEFGDQTWDELNLIVKGGNYGWPEAEGSAKIDGLINPQVVWKTSEASPSGLAYWEGELWMAALRGERLWEIPLTGDRAGDPTPHFTEKFGRLRSVTVASDGKSMVLTASNTDGRADPRAGDDRVMRVTR